MMNFNHVRRDEEECARNPWWKRRTIMERRLIIVTAITTLVMLSLLVTLVVLYSDRHLVCESGSCVRAASEILSYVDGEIDPCDDFYQFACGNFFRDTDSDDDKSASMKEIMDNILINQIRGTIEIPVKKEEDTPSVAKTKSFYVGCMNETAIDSQPPKIIKEILRGIGGWPSINTNWRENDYEWYRATHKLRKLGYTFDLFLSIEIGVNRNDETKHIVEIKPPRSHRLELKDRFKDLYLNYITDISVMLGAPRNRAEREAKDVLDFQEGLRKVIKRSEERNKDGNTFNPRTISELHYEIPTVPWFDYINQTLQFPSEQIRANEMINVPDIVYIKDLMSLLRRAPKRVQANFISWRFVQDFVEFLPKPFRRRKQKYVDETNGYRERTRWEFCLKSVQDVMPFTLKELYIEMFITEDIKEKVKALTDLIRRRFDKRIKRFDWLDQRGIEMAKEKIANLKIYVADNDPDYGPIDSAYTDVQILQDRFLLSLLELRRIKTDLEYRTMDDPVKLEIEETRRMLYNIKTNTLIIPVDYLHGIYFDTSRPNYMNYAGLGTIIAKELSNMFLDGRNYDANGNQMEWTTSETLLNYYRKIKCHGEHFMMFYVPEVDRIVNDSMIQIEDLAEVAGKKFAYDAYRFWASNNDLEASLPGVNYTYSQLFWIASTLHQCMRDSPEDAESILQSENATLTRFRLNGALRNLEQFSAAFNCPLGSPMNPVKKCTMW